MRDRRADFPILCVFLRSAGATSFLGIDLRWDFPLRIFIGTKLWFRSVSIAKGVGFRLVHVYLPLPSTTTCNHRRSRGARAFEPSQSPFSWELTDNSLLNRDPFLFVLKLRIETTARPGFTDGETCAIHEQGLSLGIALLMQDYSCPTAIETRLLVI